MDTFSRWAFALLIGFITMMLGVLAIVSLHELIKTGFIPLPHPEANVIMAVVFIPATAATAVGAGMWSFNRTGKTAPQAPSRPTATIDYKDAAAGYKAVSAFFPPLPSNGERSKS